MLTTRLDIWTKEEVKHRVRVREKMCVGVDCKVLKRFGHVEQSCGEQLTETVWEKKTEAGIVGGG